MTKRIGNIVLNGIRTFIIPGSLFIVSFILIHQGQKKLWGEFVAEMLLVNLIAHIIQWGSKERLLRSFSQFPSQIQDLFYNNLISRGLILVPAAIIILIFTKNINTGFLLILWVLGLFIYQSAESLIIYSKKFRVQVALEVFTLFAMLVYLVTAHSLSIHTLLLAFAAVVWFKAIVIGLVLFPKFKWTSLDPKEFIVCLPFFLIGLSGLLQSRIDQYIIALFSDKVTIGAYQVFLSAFILLQAFSTIIIVPFTKTLYRVNIDIYAKIERKMVLIGAGTVLILGFIFSILLIHLFQLDIPIFYFILGGLFAFPPFVYVPIIYLYYRIGKEKEIMYVNYGGALINLSVTLIFVSFGFPFLAILGSTVTQWAMLVWYVYRKKAIVNEVKMSQV